MRSRLVGAPSNGTVTLNQRIVLLSSGPRFYRDQHYPLSRDERTAQLTFGVRINAVSTINGLALRLHAFCWAQ